VSSLIIRIVSLFFANRRQLQDNPRVWWDTGLVVKTVEDYVKKWGIEAIITFDDGGVSGHVNHRSVGAGVRYSPGTFFFFADKTTRLIFADSRLSIDDRLCIAQVCDLTGFTCCAFICSSSINMDYVLWRWSRSLGINGRESENVFYRKKGIRTTCKSSCMGQVTQKRRFLIIDGYTWF